MLNRVKSQSNPLVLILLGGIVLLLMVLILVLVFNGPGPQGGRDKPVVEAGKTYTPTSDDAPPPPKESVSKPERIRETLKSGQFYEIVLKAGFDARIETQEWGIREVVSLAYLAEMRIVREIEENDGHRIVEKRSFDKCRNAKLLCRVEDVSLNIGVPGELILLAADSIMPGAGSVLGTTAPFARSMLMSTSQAVLDDKTARAFAHIDSLTGKTIRIVYVDGKGVESLTPLNCTLTEAERDFLMTTAVLSDCYILPEIDLEVGSTWSVDGAQFAGMTDPTWRGVPTGEVTVRRAKNIADTGKKFAVLNIVRGSLIQNSSDKAKRRMGTFVPRGELRYSLTDDHVSLAELVGDLTIEEVSQDHLLFETSFKSSPTMHVQYTCRILP